MLSSGAGGTEFCALLRRYAACGCARYCGAALSHQGLRGVYKPEGCGGGVCAASTFGEGPGGREIGGGTRSSRDWGKDRPSATASWVACPGGNCGCRE